MKTGGNLLIASKDARKMWKAVKEMKELLK